MNRGGRVQCCSNVQPSFFYKRGPRPLCKIFKSHHKVIDVLVFSFPTTSKNFQNMMANSRQICPDNSRAVQLEIWSTDHHGCATMGHHGCWKQVQLSSTTDNISSSSFSDFSPYSCKQKPPCQNPPPKVHSCFCCRWNAHQKRAPSKWVYFKICLDEVIARNSLHSSF